MFFRGPPFRIAFRNVRTTRSTQVSRKYATEQPQGQGKSDIPKLIGIVSLTAGAAYYFLRSNRAESHADRDEFVKGEKRQASTAAGESEPEPDRDSAQKITSPGSNSGGSSLGQPPSTVDAAGARKEPGGAGTISGKQEGISNSTTDNPYINEPGKSRKGEGEVESAKVKGTVAPERPQA